MAKNKEIPPAPEEAKELPPEVLMTDTEWDGQKTQEYGGQSDILAISPGQIAGPLTYLGCNRITTDLGETTAHTASDKMGETWRLPIQATFLRAMDQAAVKPGDVFAIKRGDDVIKKKGAGAGKPMAIFSIKVLKRPGQPF